jgi:uncharacterized membrane protein
MDPATVPASAVPSAILSAVHFTPTGAVFDIVLLLHVACATVGLGTVVVSGVQAGRLLAAGGAGPSPTLVAYFAPGVNWVGRVLYAVPLLGLALLGLSQGAYGLDDGWVQWGLGLWVVAILCAEGLLWPAERRIQSKLEAHGADPAAPELRRACRTTCLAAGWLVAVLILAIVLMVARP